LNPRPQRPERCALPSCATSRRDQHKSRRHHSPAAPVSSGLMTEPLVEGVVHLPAPHLRPYIERYIGYRMEGFPPGIHRGLPSRHLTFIISLRDPIHVDEMPGCANLTGSFPSVVSGFFPGPAIIRHDGIQVGVAAEVSPLGARALLGMPSGELAGSIAELPEVFGPRSASLPDRLASSDSWHARFDLLDRMFSARLDDGRAPQPEVTYAWRRMIEANGNFSVQALAQKIGWSRRHLLSRFRSEIGLSPKSAGRMLRFERACQMLRRSRKRSLSEVAVECGYFDQAHFSRDFHDFAGCSPTQWLAEEFPSVQDSLVSVGTE
jgi:AraC-like DNA-binding protein